MDQVAKWTITALSVKFITETQNVDVIYKEI